ncbi:Ammonium transporter NrgA [Hydrogenovibrio crunogenus]|uniref:Ammonium transporter n=1 Tax=Hydrogenovibrio crunogenus TaxID=39765 RepID=A0A4P7P244_9GAMM|nr:ammonium transporter [Hydrogenovibrio crunogenus]QBZ84221.1 Ammonium transporter NrgA [Hydrogenovibrio crunogenus]
MSEQLIDILWVLISAVLVALMQPGFTALEAGATRTKNSISTAIKNVSDFLIAFMIFVVVGASIMLGTSHHGVFGWSPIFFYETSLPELILTLFHAMFVSTAVTIISGSIAERTKYTSYLIIAVIVSLFIYPVQAHWIWNSDGWLAQLGFIDFAGSTVVHSVGGWAALAAILIIGPRLGRFETKENPFEQANLAYSALGVFLIWLGWIGFNGGSVLALNYETGKVILNTLIAGAIGGITGLIISRFYTGYYQVIDIINGILAGLVAITASAHLASPAAAILVGMLGYLAYLSGKILLVKWKIDDALEAVPVHLFAGVAGTLLVAFLVDEVSFWQQFKIQLLGIIVVGLLTFLISYTFLSVINRFYPLRVSESKEILGLNISEHQASTSMFDLAQAMNNQAQQQDFSKKIMVEPYSDASLIATYYNHVTQAFNQLNDEKEALIEESYQMANYDQLTGLAKRRLLVNELGRSIARLDRHPQSNAILFIDLDGFKSINDQHGHNAGDALLKEAAARIQKIIRKTDLAARFGGDEFVVLLENIQNESFAAQVADKIIAALRSPILLSNNSEGQISASIGLKIFNASGKQHIDDILNQADKAMYEAKRRGKGQWVLA